MHSEVWSREELRALDAMGSPAAIQAFLDSIPYSDDHFYRCPRRVLADRKAHCFDGAVLAAAALRRLGHRPLLLDMRAVRDDDHVIALFRERGRLGAVAKSNFVGLRFREPVYRSARELVMSYFEAYYNLEREKTLRAYSLPVSLEPFEALGWETGDAAMEAIAARLNRVRHVPILTPEVEAALAPVDERSYAAGMLGVNAAGLYKP
jgi:hypothetical protein